MSRANGPSPRGSMLSSLPWFLLGCAVVAVVAGSLRYGTSVRELPLKWDETFHMPIVERIAAEGWTRSTLIDYDDTKGPVFFWAYAVVGEVFGFDFDTMRLITAAFFIAGIVPLLMLARLADVPPQDWPLLAMLYGTLPYLGATGQLFMSEPSFILGALLLVLVYTWTRSSPGKPGSGSPRPFKGKGIPATCISEHSSSMGRWIPLALYGIVLTLLLHHRIHIVAVAGAICLVAWLHDGRRSWPWWAVTFAAGLGRLPLLFHWGGLVGSTYQGRYGLGLRFDSLTYLAIALLPFLFVFMVNVLWDRRGRSRFMWIGVAGAAGLVLAVLAPPQPTLDSEEGRYMGMVMSPLREVLGGTPLFGLAIMLLAPLGTAALGALCWEAWNASRKGGQESPGTDDCGRWEISIDGSASCISVLVLQVTTATIVLGWLLHALTQGDVFDRYLISFTFLLPLIFIQRMSHAMAMVQLLAWIILTIIQATIHL